MNWSSYFARLTAWVLIGAVLGLLVGVILYWLDVVENPFWAMAAGIFVGAIFMPLKEAASSTKRPSGGR